MRRRLSPLLFALAAVALVGCTDDEDPPAAMQLPPPPELPERWEESHVDYRGQEEVVISVIDNDFEPENFQVDVGTVIVFSNDGLNGHNWIPVDEDSPYDVIPQESLGRGQSATMTADVPGRFPYYCSIHGTATAGQRGYLVVGDL